MLHAHSLHIMHMIGKLIQLLNEPENLLSKVVELGERHFDRKANDELLQYFCPAYVEAMAKKGQWKKKTIIAWEKFFDFIRAAMVHGLKKRKGHSSISNTTSALNTAAEKNHNSPSSSQ
ncbi:uncharacterized protein LOC134856700 [Symsagittifera roscoffensis]|uniref:uncharacterized protein LOC134856700 n=1 Tax=Symsagittifera roscoffensis TaxID=84072 RepID=UPI00307C0C27